MSQYRTWQPFSFTNPFSENPEIVSGRVSGRRADILEIITSGQSAFILTGAPDIGKSALIRYLKSFPGADWSWRNELSDLSEIYNLNEIQFSQIGLIKLENAQNIEELFSLFVGECFRELSLLYQRNQQDSDSSSTSDKGVRELKDLLRQITKTVQGARYFITLDAIERIGKSSIQFSTSAQTEQERGIALLEHSGVLRLLVDLVDEFKIFGVILSIESDSRPEITHQFSRIPKHISADLARFTTMSLQIFAWEDAKAFLAQKPEHFGSQWAKDFKEAVGNCIFTDAEQIWLLEQAGTHPYLLQQFCFHTFHYKSTRGKWTELEELEKKFLLEKIYERLSTFLTRIWKRLQRSLEKSSPETRANFVEFVNEVERDQFKDQLIKLDHWDHWGAELRFILKSEGIVRHDLSQPIHFPGLLIRQFLIQKVNENRGWLTYQTTSSPAVRGFWITITHVRNQPERISVSELEYRLLKTLLQQPQRTSMDELMIGAWGKLVDKPTFSQRMYHLRRRLKESSGGIEVIENHYGGWYSLKNPEWFQLE